MRTIKIAATTIIAVIAAMQCAHASPTPAMKPIKVTAKMTYPDGKPATDGTMVLDIINSVTHAVTEQTFKPDATGTVAITIDPNIFVNSIPVVYAISPTGIGFWGGGSPNTVLTSVLQPFTSIHIHVVDAAGKPIAHVRICPGTLMQTNAYGNWNEYVPGTWTQTTDADGNATLTKLPQGYKLVVNVADDRFGPPDNKTPIQLATAATTPDATVQVTPASSISGTVLFGATKKPVVGIQVTASEMGLRAPGITDATGAFTIHRISPGTYTMITVDNTGAFKNWVSQSQKVVVPAGAETTHVNLFLTTGGIVIGKITDVDTGKPIPNVSVMVNPKVRAGAYYNGASTTTGPDGNYRVHVVPGKITVSLAFTGLPVPFTPQEFDLSDGETKTADFHIKTPIPPTVVHGLVVDPSGNPVASADITVSQKNNMDQSYTTDAQGHFTIDNPGLIPGALIVARSADLATANPITFDGKSDVTIHLATGVLSTVKGQIKDKNGKPLAGAEVELMEHSGFYQSSFAQVQSDAQGDYSFPRVFGGESYSVSASPAGYTTANSQNFETTSGQTYQVPDLISQSADSFVGGTVIGANGKPIVGASVSDSDVPGNSATTDAAGHFMIKGVPEGKTGVSVSTNDNNWAYEEVTAGSGDNTISITTDVNGLVVGPNGKPVPNAEVIAWSKNYGARTVTTDNSGRFTIDSPGLTAKATLIARSGNLCTSAECTYNGEDPLTLTLAAGSVCIISGKVVDINGAPLSGAKVSLMCLEHDMGADLGSVQTDAQGNYSFPPAYGGSSYNVTASAKGYGSTTSSQATIAAGQTFTVPVLKLKVANNFVGGTVVDSKGNPVPNVTVSDNDVQDLQTTTDQAGHFMLNGVPDGKTGVSVQSDTGGWGNGDVVSGRGDNVVYFNRQ